MLRKTVFILTLLTLVNCIVLSPLSVSAEKSDEQSYGTEITNSSVIENDCLKLEVNNDGRVTLLYKITNYEWVSNPSDKCEDKIAFGVNKQRIMSQVLINYLGTSVIIMTTSFAQAVKENNAFVKSYHTKNKITSVYDFGTLGIVIPVVYSIEKNILSVTVTVDEIQETRKNRLVDFTVNPFFGAGTSNEKGFIMIPDGSGALIDFNNGKINDNQLILDVMYGNKSVVNKSKLPKAQNVLVPCFGISKTINNSNPTMLAFVKSGAIGGQLITNVSGRETDSNYCYYKFYYRESTKQIMLDRTYAAKVKMIVYDKPVSNKKFEMCYSFTDKGLSSMADSLRKMIFNDEENEKKAIIPLYLDMIMGVRVKQNFLGIPYHTLRTLTTLDDVKSIISDCKENQTNSLIIKLTGFTNDGILPGKIDSSLKISSKVGNVKKLKSLYSENIKLYPSVNPIEFQRSGNGARTFFSSSFNLLRDTVKIPTFLVASGAKNRGIEDISLIKPLKINDLVQKLYKSFENNKINFMSPSVLGQGTYCDYTKGKVSDINNTLEILKTSIKKLSKNNSLLMDSPSYYAWNFTDNIMNLPDDSSHYNICDHTVPFLQMVLSGIVNSYSSNYINNSGDTTQEVLKCIKNGSAPMFSVFKSDYSDLRNTDAKDYYGSEYSCNKNDINSIYKKVSEALSSVYGYRIIDFMELQDGVTLSVYSNNKSVIVNSTNRNFTYRGISVLAYSYYVLETEDAQ